MNSRRFLGTDRSAVWAGTEYPGSTRASTNCRTVGVATTRIATTAAGFVLSLAALVTGGCAPEVGTDFPQCNQYDPAAPQCPAGSVCVRFRCRQLCSSSRECPAKYEACFFDQEDEPPGYCFPYEAHCGANADCHEGFYCAGDLCEKLPANADCTNGITDGLETDTDCGGAYCSPCEADSSCETDRDCSSSVCSADGVCQAPRCDDARQNGDETDADCGGPCQRCGDGSGCRYDDDCASSVCTEDVCQAPSCSDGVANGLEAGIDCGRPESGCSGCETGAACDLGADCADGICSENQCAAPACDDGTENGTETDVDCGGICRGCEDGDRCWSRHDCASGRCGALRCLTEGRVFGAAHTDGFWDVEITADGNIVAVGEYSDPIDYGTGELPCESIGGVYCKSTPVVAMFQPNGRALWATPLLNGEPGSLRAVSVLPGGDIAVAGRSLGTRYGVLVARLDKGGGLVWLRTIGEPSGSGVAEALATDFAGRLVVGGSFHGTLEFGETQISGSQRDPGAFVAVFSDDGSPQWAAGYDGAGYDGARAVGFLGSDVIVAGDYQSEIDFGSGGHASAGDFDIFVARVTGGGAEVWSKTYGGSSRDGAQALVVASGRSVFVTGGSAGRIDFGGGPVDALGSYDAYVLHLSEDGEFVDARRLGGFGSASGVSMSERPDGNLVVAGWFSSTFYVGSGRLESRGETDGFVALFWPHPPLQLLSMHQIGGTGSDAIAGITSAQGGAAAVVGTFTGAADFGWGPVDSVGDGDTFLVTLSP